MDPKIQKVMRNSKSNVPNPILSVHCSQYCYNQRTFLGTKSQITNYLINLGCVYELSVVAFR